MRCLHAALGLALSLLPLTAADPTIGLGLSVKGDTSTLFAPFQLRPNLRLEGLMTFSCQTGSFDDTRRDWGVGAGLFHVRPLADDFQLYAGGRLAYSTTKRSSHDSEYFNGRTYSITPLIGIEYRLNRHFSLAGEVGVQGARFLDKIDSSSINRHGTNWSSHNNMVLRVWF